MYKALWSILVINLQMSYYSLRLPFVYFLLCNGRLPGVESTNYPEFGLTGSVTPNDYIIHWNQPVTISCFVKCTQIVPGRVLNPILVMRVKSDNYLQHLTTGAKEDVLEEIIYYPDDPLSCDGDIEKDYFSFNISSIGNHEEVLVSCGLTQQNCSPIQDTTIVPVRKYMPKIFSEQISNFPAIVVKEEDTATFNLTCEKPANETMTRVYWTLEFKDTENETEIFFDDSESVELKNGLILRIQESLSNESDLQSYSLSILNLTRDLSGMKVTCGICWEEGNFTKDKLFEQAAGVIVLPREKPTVFSYRAQNTSAKEGDNVTISCQRSTGTSAEWYLEFPDGMSLSYTENESTLIEKGLIFQNSDSSVDSEELETYSVTIMNIQAETFNNAKIRCAALEYTTTGSKIVTNNTFEDVLLIKEELRGIGTISDSWTSCTCTMPYPTPLFCPPVTPIRGSTEPSLTGQQNKNDTEDSSFIHDHIIIIIVMVVLLATTIICAIPAAVGIGVLCRRGQNR